MRTAPRSTAPAPRASSSGAKLVCVAGPCSGMEFPLAGEEELVIGRAADNPISIPDTSVSRRHLGVRKLGNGWVAQDLGSGNGTLINGAPPSDGQALRNGDVLTLGDTELSFVDLDTQTDKRAAPRMSGSIPARRATTGAPDVRARLRRQGAPSNDPGVKGRKRRVLLLVTVVAALLVGGLVFLKREQDKQSLARRAEQQRITDARAQLGAWFQEATHLVREGKWVQAKERLEQIREQAPNYPGVADYLARAEVEIPIQQRLAEAEAAVEKNRLGEAMALLKQVNPDTQQWERESGIRSRVEGKLTARVAEAAAAANRSEFQAAIDIAEDVLQAFPGNRDAALIAESAKRALDAKNAPKVVVAGPAPKLWEPAVSRYLDGDISGALAVLDDCARQRAPRCAELGKDMRDFSALFKRVEDLDARGLSRLLSLDRQITGGRQSKMAATAGTRAGTIFYKSASSAKASGQWAKAIEYAQRALEADTGNAGARAILEELRKKAQDIYFLGYQQRATNPDEALARFQEVVAMTPPGDEWHEKAKGRIRELAP
jgi:tetratricopeptide (TPR) repeat protein